MIGLKAPGNYSASIWYNKYRFACQEKKILYFYDIGIFEPVTKPQNQLCLFLEPPGHATNQDESSNIFKNIMLVNLGILTLQNVDICRKGGHRQMMKIR